eukprot:GFYU01003648.1.p1 GENE.GFYU01003648.1~~GFYU01003648.1.p1  ORF type:complete len:257 (-),score=81.95 GFYU01003648.1:273-1043(-)
MPPRERDPARHDILAKRPKARIGHHATEIPIQKWQHNRDRKETHRIALIYNNLLKKAEDPYPFEDKEDRQKRLRRKERVREWWYCLHTNKKNGAFDKAVCDLLGISLKTLERIKDEAKATGGKFLDDEIRKKNKSNHVGKKNKDGEGKDDKSKLGEKGAPKAKPKDKAPLKPTPLKPHGAHGVVGPPHAVPVPQPQMIHHAAAMAGLGGSIQQQVGLGGHPQLQMAGVPVQTLQQHVQMQAPHMPQQQPKPTPKMG